MPSSSLNKIQHIARTMKFASCIVGSVCVGLIVWLWISPERLETKLIPALHLEGGYLLDADARLQFFVATLLPFVLVLLILKHTYQLFAAYSTGEILTLKNARHLRYIAILVALVSCVRPLIIGLYKVILSAAPISYSIRIGMGDVLTLLFAGLLFAISLVLAEAARLREENEGFI